MGLESKLTDEKEKQLFINMKKYLKFSSKLDCAIGLVVGLGGSACFYVITGNPAVGAGAGVLFAAPWLYSGYSKSKQIKELTQNG